MIFEVLGGSRNDPKSILGASWRLLGRSCGLLALSSRLLGCPKWSWVAFGGSWTGLSGSWVASGGPGPVPGWAGVAAHRRTLRDPVRSHCIDLSIYLSIYILTCVNEEYVGWFGSSLRCFPFQLSPFTSHLSPFTFHLSPFNWIELVWISLDYVELTWIGLVWTELNCIDGIGIQYIDICE